MLIKKQLRKKSSVRKLLKSEADLNKNDEDSNGDDDPFA